MYPLRLATARVLSDSMTGVHNSLHPHLAGVEVSLIDVSSLNTRLFHAVSTTAKIA